MFHCNIARRWITHSALVKTNDRFRVAVVGAFGDAGGELIRLLLAHPHAELTAVTSQGHLGKT